MGVQETSVIAYQSIAGGLSASRRRVYDVIVSTWAQRTRGICDKEIADALSRPINTVTPRRGELVELAVVEHHCTTTGPEGRPVMYWRPKVGPHTTAVAQATKQTQGLLFGKGTK